jgi:hypothetical protein
MTKRIGVVVVHGIGDQQANFADDFIEKVRRDLGEEGKDVVWKPVWWAPILAERQASLLRRLGADNDLDFLRLRNFVVHAMGDAVAYQRAPSNTNARYDIYQRIHEKVARDLHDLSDELRSDLPPGAKMAPLVVVAHSLGCHIMSNHIWDLQQGTTEPFGNSPFERFQTLAGMITVGCNMPLFTAAYDSPEPIGFPGPAFRECFRPDATAQQCQSAAKWLNIYDPDDVLGYPLRPLSPAYKRTVRADIERNIGGLATSWNPASHTEYFSDEDVIKEVVGMLSGLLELM